MAHPSRHHPIRRSRRTFPASPPSRAPAALVIALLIGVGFSLLATGLIEQLYRTLDCTPSTFQLGIGTLLLATALGPRLLRGLALRLAREARMRLSRGIEQRVGGARVAVDRDLLWIATGVAGLAAGVGALALPFLLGRAEAVLSWGYTRVLWTDGSLPAWETAVVFVAVVAPFALLGFFLRCVHQLICPVGRWDFGALAWALMGCGLGLAGARWAGGYPPEALLLLLRVGALPLLLAAMVSIAKASPAARRSAVVDAPTFVEPEIGERWPTVLRSAVMVGVCAVTTVAFIWVHVVSSLGMWGRGGVLWAGSLLLIGGGAGLGWAVHQGLRVEHTIGGFGSRCAVSGLSLAGGAAVFNLVVRRSFAPFLETPGGGLLWMVCAVLPLAVGGYVIGYGLLAVLRRSANVADSGSRLLRLVLLAVGFAAGFVALGLLERLGSYATLVAAALALLATGGILTIHAPVADWRQSGVRVSSIFAAVLLMAWWMPLAGAGWLHGGTSFRGAGAESWWLAGASIREPHGGGRALRRVGSRLASPIDWSSFSSRERVGCVSFKGRGSLLPSSGFRGHLTRLMLAPGAAESHRSGERLHGFKALRAGADRFDLLTLSFEKMPRVIRCRTMTRHLIDRALIRLAPDGVLAAVLPDDPSLRGEATTLLAELAVGRGRLLGWSPCPAAEGDAVVLFIGRAESSALNAWRWGRQEVTPFDPQQGPQAWSAAMLGAPHDETAPSQTLLSASR